MGLTVLTPAPATWAANTGYAQNSQVVPAQANGHYYQAVTAGVSSANAPAFPVDQETVSESPGVQYLDAGTSLPASAKLKVWSKNTAFFLNDTILDPTMGHYYSVVQPGISGDDPPQFSVSSLTSGTVSGGTASQPVAWQDLGATLPSSVTPGTAPADVTVNLLNYTYPQVHALSRFNLASGIVFDFIKPPQLVNTGSQSSPSYVSAPGTPLVDAVLAVTAYIKPMDAERKFQRSDLIPGATVGFSLTSPSSNFYFGGSSELFLRNLQVMGGVALLKISELGPTATGSTTVPATVQQEKVRGFVGVSFNITGFLQTLF